MIFWKRLTVSQVYQFTRVMAEKMFGFNESIYSIFIGTRMMVVGSDSRKFSEFLESDSIRWLPPSIISASEEDEDEDENGNKRKKQRNKKLKRRENLSWLKLMLENFWIRDVGWYKL